MLGPAWRGVMRGVGTEGGAGRRYLNGHAYLLPSRFCHCPRALPRPRVHLFFCFSGEIKSAERMLSMWVLGGRVKLACGQRFQVPARLGCPAPPPPSPLGLAPARGSRCPNWTHTPGCACLSGLKSPPRTGGPPTARRVQWACDITAPQTLMDAAERAAWAMPHRYGHPKIAAVIRRCPQEGLGTGWGRGGSTLLTPQDPLLHPHPTLPAGAGNPQRGEVGSAGRSTRGGIIPETEQGPPQQSSLPRNPGARTLCKYWVLCPFSAANGSDSPAGSRVMLSDPPECPQTHDP